jgi:hypothetical protein
MSDYHKLSVGEKRAQALATVRESAIACPSCDTQVMPADMPSHLERCGGPREPGVGSKWITWQEALALGAPARSIVRWRQRGLIRTRGGRGDRQYLLRDLVKRVASRRYERRR